MRGRERSRFILLLLEEQCEDCDLRCLLFMVVVFATCIISNDMIDFRIFAMCYAIYVYRHSSLRLDWDMNQTTTQVTCNSKYLFRFFRKRPRTANNVTAYSLEYGFESQTSHFDEKIADFTFVNLDRELFLVIFEQWPALF